MTLSILINIIFWLFFALLAMLTCLPFVKAPWGAVRGPAFPRLQFFWTGVALSILAYLLLPPSSSAWIITGLLAMSALNAAFIVKFTRFWPVQSAPASEAERKDSARHVSIIAANIKQSNKDFTRLLTYVQDEDPDIAILIEVTDAWLKAVSPLTKTYPYTILHPTDTGYGMAMYSKLQIEDHDLRTLITDGVPSIRARVTLRSGDPFRLYIVHPEPPTLAHDTKGRDSEMVQVGLEARDDPLPTIVTGDLNDVAWSTTTRRFQRVSRLLDPRVGRGFFNTFHADFPMFRWPLDHLFHDARFRLISLDRGPNIGSDHFPVAFKLAFAETDAGWDQLQEHDAQEERDARDMIKTERARDRNAIGEDWEEG